MGNTIARRRTRGGRHHSRHEQNGPPSSRTTVVLTIVRESHTHLDECSSIEADHHHDIGDARFVYFKYRGSLHDVRMIGEDLRLIARRADHV